MINTKPQKKKSGPKKPSKNKQTKTKADLSVNYLKMKSLSKLKTRTHVSFQKGKDLSDYQGVVRNPKTNFFSRLL